MITFRRGLWHRLQAFLHRTVVVHAMLTLAWALAAFAAAFGTAFIAAPHDVLRVPTFTHNFTFAPPHIWGLGYLALAVFLALTLVGSKRDAAAYPLWGLAFLTCLWGLLTVPAVTAMSGAVTAVIVYPFVAFVMAVVGAALDFQERSDAT